MQVFQPSISTDTVHSLLCGWWRCIAVTRCVEPTKLLYGGPG